jgi:hypothetical protein
MASLGVILGIIAPFAFALFVMLAIRNRPFLAPASPRHVGEKRKKGEERPAGPENTRKL